MASSLASQLALIRAKGTNPLDLKAQKKAHSQSLLFDPQIAASQDFDTIYIICYEGFQELCKLDSRFISFANTIFSEQSIREDRTQMTVSQNKNLDTSLEEYLGMVGGRLLLKPAIKSVEWLVRRFRVHEKNTFCLAMAFIPYHTHPIFQSLLSILPESLPPTIKFLYPYRKNLTNPPRHVIVYSATHNPAFLANMNARILEVCRLGYGFPALCSFWSTVVLEAVAAMLEQSRSGRRMLQSQGHEDILLRVMPTLNDGLALANAPDIQIGCYMILIVLANKASLDDAVLTAAMEAIVSNWARTKHAGLVCLVILTQHRCALTLPKKVLRVLSANKKLADDLLLLKSHYKVENIVLGVLLGNLDGLRENNFVHQLSLVQSLLEADLIDDSFLTSAIMAVSSTAQKAEDNTMIQKHLLETLLNLADNTRMKPVVKSALKTFDVRKKHLEPRIHEILYPGADVPDQTLDEHKSGAEDSNIRLSMKSSDNDMSYILTRSAHEMSFLSSSNSAVFDRLARMYLSAFSSSENLKIFLELPALRLSRAANEPYFLSFLIRFWCSSYSAMARAIAINSVSEYLKLEKPGIDVQILFPYILHGLADPSLIIRRASTDLIMVLDSMYAREAIDKCKNQKILGEKDTYGKMQEDIIWLSTKEAAKFIKEILLSRLEEFLLDPNYISRRLSEVLRSPKETKNLQKSSKELKASTRQSFFAFICSHVANTPLFNVKHSLLRMLNQVDKVGNLSRTKALLPMLLDCEKRGQQEFLENCVRNHVDSSQLLELFVEVVSPTDRDGVNFLKQIIEAEKWVDSPSLPLFALRRIRAVWPSIKPDLQNDLSEKLLQLAFGDQGVGKKALQKDEIIIALQKVPLSTSILQTFIEICMTFPYPLQESALTPKRRRTSRGYTLTSDKTNLRDSELAVARLAFVLELVEIHHAEQHPQLLKGLFQILAELQDQKGSSGTEMAYLQVLTLENILAIIKEIEKSPVMNLDKSVIRLDVLVDSVKNTASAQIQHIAFLLIASLAGITPELVLHSIMPIFTSMGASVLRRHDEYSAYVVKQAMESVLPRLVDSLRKQKSDPIIGISELVLSFVATFKHIPSQRRLELFKSLADKLSSADYLFAILVVLLDQYPQDKEVVRFAADLILCYDVDTYLKTVGNYMDVIIDTLMPSRSVSEYLVTVNANKDVDTAVANLLHLLTATLDDKRLIMKIRKALEQKNDSALSIGTAYEGILEQVLVLSNITGHDKRLVLLCNNVLDSLLSLLSVPELVRINQSLLTRTKDEIRQQVLQSFQQRLQNEKSSQEPVRSACVSFLPSLTPLMMESTNLSLKHTALSVVDSISEKYGKSDLAAARDAVMIIAGDQMLGRDEASIRIASLLCLATMVEVLRDSFMPFIPAVFPKALYYLNTSITDDAKDHRLHIAVYSFMSALLLYIPWVITGAYLERVLVNSYESANSKMGGDCDRERSEALQLIARQIEPQVVYVGMGQTWTRAMSQGPNAVKEYLRILHLTIKRQTKSSVMRHVGSIADILIKVFDLRRLQHSPRAEGVFEDSDIEESESALFETTIAMIYKINDAKFRPVFQKMVDWATDPASDKDGKGTTYRQTTLYAFLSKFFSNLKSLVTSYAGFVLEDMVKILKEVSLVDDDSKNLWRQALIALRSAIQHDEDDFWQSLSHFGPISEALLFQLSRAPHVSMTAEVIPTLTELVASAEISDQHRDLNSAILRYTRSDSAAVRIAAVQCEYSLTIRLGEEWLALLPEMLPFISELQEDDDESVERETQRWVLKIEEILGEKLHPMLQ